MKASLPRHRECRTERSPFGVYALTLSILFGSVLARAEGDLKPFQEALSENTLFAEQVLPKWVPAEKGLLHLLEKISPKMKRVSGMPAEYLPESRNTYALTTLLVPVEEMQSMAAVAPGQANPLVTTVDGRQYFRFHIHPVNLPYYEKELKKYRQDSTRWIATPSASTRSVYVRAENAPELGISIEKLSLNQTFAGASRSISRSHIVRAVTMTKLLDEVRAETDGKLPGGKRWYFMRENVGALLPGHEEGGSIHRELPRELDLEKKEILPYLALIGQAPGKERWIDTLYRKSGYSDRKEFLWQELMRPLEELHSELSIRHGITTEFHLQNACFVIDRETGKVDGVVIRDMDSMLVDKVYREGLLGKTAYPAVDAWVPTPDADLNVFRAQAVQTRSLYYLRKHTVDFVARQFLSDSDRADLLRAFDQSYLAKLKERFPRYTLTQVDQLPPVWDDIHRRATPADAPPPGKLDARYNFFARLLNFRNRLNIVASRACNARFRVISGR